MKSASELYEEEKRKFMTAEQARNQAEMLRQQAAMNATNPFSRDGLMALLFLACCVAGVFALMHFLGN